MERLHRISPAPQQRLAAVAVAIHKISSGTLQGSLASLSPSHTPPFVTVPSAEVQNLSLNPSTSGSTVHQPAAPVASLPARRPGESSHDAFSKYRERSSFRKSPSPDNAPSASSLAWQQVSSASSLIQRIRQNSSQHLTTITMPFLICILGESTFSHTLICLHFPKRRSRASCYFTFIDIYPRMATSADPFALVVSSTLRWFSFYHKSTTHCGDPTSARHHRLPPKGTAASRRLDRASLRRRLFYNRSSTDDASGHTAHSSLTASHRRWSAPGTLPGGQSKLWFRRHPRTSLFRVRIIVTSIVCLGLRIRSISCRRPAVSTEPRFRSRTLCGSCLCVRRHRPCSTTTPHKFSVEHESAIGHGCI
ncbi:unnamed protein product [Haemonchus placei]|uniref:Uncharacterized protein n=1 Tax=Haemonchus placei TaxID=6290 RepID=A0A3P7VHU3_HAEPC|nr:unnamed protein product [Haemonchus placei]